MSSGPPSPDFYRQLFEKVSDAIVVYDPETAVVVDANPAVAELTGYAAETLVGRPVTQFSSGSPEEIERSAAEFVDRAAEGDQAFEWLIERADGTVRTTTVSLHRADIEGEDRVLAILRDVTERERDRAQLEESRQRLSLLTQRSPDVFWMFSPDWEECLFVNDAYERVWGRSTEALLNDPTDFLAGVHPDDQETVREVMQKLANGSRVETEYRVNESEDFQRWVWVEGVPVYEDGELTRHVGFARDITDRKRLESELRANEQAISALHTRAAQTDLSLDQQIRELLEIGRERLDLPIAFATRIEGQDQYIIETAGAYEGISTGQHQQLEDAYCRRTIEQEGLLGIQNAPEEGWADDPAYQASQLNCYLGGKLIVDDELYGTVCFASPDPREREFSEIERAFVELLVQWLGYEIERDRYQSELESLTQEVTSILQASPLALLEVDDEAVIRRWNPAAEALFGLPESEAVGTNYPKISESRRPVFEALFERVMAGETVTNFEGAIEQADGTRRDLSINAAPVSGAGNEVSGAVVAVSDVTPERRRQRRIEAVRRATHRLVEAHTDEAVASIAVEAPAEVVDSAAAAFWRFDETTDGFNRIASTDAWDDHDGTDDLEAAVANGGDWEPLREVIHTGRIQRLEDVAAFHPTGSDATTAIVGVPVGRWGVLLVIESGGAFSETGTNVLEVLAGALDSAFGSVEFEQQLHATERELRRQNEQLEEFAHVVAHDIRGPLTAARGFFEIALETDADEHFQRVADAHTRMERMIDDLLTLARQGRSIAEREPVDVEELARTAWTQVRGDASIEIEAGLPVVSADASRLEEVLTNLFRNAVEHGSTSPPSRTQGDAVEHGGSGVTVSIGPLTDDDGAVKGIFVEDDGPGIPPEKHPHVFEFGYTTDPNGTGLGLSIVKEVVEAHGWAVSVTDGRSGGARFEIETDGSEPVVVV